jgi:hypothetical protein
MSCAFIVAVVVAVVVVAFIVVSVRWDFLLMSRMVAAAMPAPICQPRSARSTTPGDSRETAGRHASAPRAREIRETSSAQAQRGRGAGAGTLAGAPAHRPQLLPPWPMRKPSRLAHTPALRARRREPRRDIVVAPMAELGLQRALAGIYVLHGVDVAALDSIVQVTAEGYEGPDVGGLDVVGLGAGGDAWLLLGRWMDCFADEVQAGAAIVFARLRDAVSTVNTGVLRAGSETTVVVPSPYRIEVEPWMIVHGAVAKGISQARWLRWLHAVFPHLPSWLGMHMGAPHWLGVGVRLEEGQIEQVTPYVRLDLRADGTVMLTGVAEDAVLRAWIPLLKVAIGV